MSLICDTRGGGRVETRELWIYRTPAGKSPFREWLYNLEWVTKKRVEAGLNRLRLGAQSDARHIAGEVWELRLHFGPGYRTYFGYWKDRIVLLLCGGDKGTQKKDLDKAKQYWADFKERML
ncbi:MAG: type II toxin-antitoxin system RelE/ParE family toxin [candidate division FCPU426 bacterium]